MREEQERRDINALTEAQENSLGWAKGIEFKLCKEESYKRTER